MPEWVVTALEGLQALFLKLKQVVEILSGDDGAMHYGGFDPPIINSLTVPVILTLPYATRDLLVINDGPDDVQIRFPNEGHIGWITVRAGESTGAGVGRATVSGGAARVLAPLTTGATLRVQLAWIGRNSG